MTEKDMLYNQSGKIYTTTTTMSFEALVDSSIFNPFIRHDGILSIHFDWLRSGILEIEVKVRANSSADNELATDKFWMEKP